MMQQFVTQHDLQYPVLLDTRNAVAQMYGVGGTPTSYLIDRSGMVVGGAAGPKEWDSKSAKQMIRHFLDQAP